MSKSICLANIHNNQKSHLKSIHVDNPLFLLLVVYTILYNLVPRSKETALNSKIVYPNW